MAKAKKKVQEPEVTKQDGDIDPYAAGKHIKNPEPNNGRDDGQAVFEGDPVEDKVVEDKVVDDAPVEGEQDEIAEGREEKVSVEK